MIYNEIKMKKIDINTKRIKFKNIISAPAPIGRILNYVYRSAKSDLYHKNGYRNASLSIDIGYAWTTELMIGLGLFEPITNNHGGKHKLVLTSKGKDLYKLIKKTDVPYSESTGKEQIEEIKNQMIKNNKALYDKYKEIFLASIPYQLLNEYLLEHGIFYENRTNFMNDYFETIKKMYDTGTKEFNRSARTTTAENRLPSLLQLCEFFDILTDEGDKLCFTIPSLSHKKSAKLKKDASKSLLKEAKKENKLIRELKESEIVKKFGVDGNQVIKSVIRNSYLQKIFRKNLLIEQNEKCILCGVDNVTLLNGSHIKPSSISGAVEKIDTNDGLLLCCNHDRLFDRCLITFSSKNGKIQLSKTLSKKDIKDLNINDKYSIPKKYLTSKRKQYLKYHNDKFKLKEKER